MKFKEAVIAVTYRCNSRCSMCDIWRKTDHNDIPPNEYLKIPRSLRTVNVTGGEPFLRADLSDVVQAIVSSTPRARLVFSTNGYLTDRIVATMERISAIHSNVGVGVSIDGRERIHDHVRGIDGMFERAVDTISQLKELGYDDLRIGMTIVPQNIGEIPHVYRLSKDLGVQFTTTVAHNSEIYFGKTDNMGLAPNREMETPLMDLVESQLKGVSVKSWFRAYHTNGIFDASLRKGLETNCLAGREYFFMAPNGDIFPCNVLNEKIGNITSVSEWSELLTAEVRKRMLRAVRECRSDCWMVCNTRSMIRAHPLRVSAWVVNKKCRMAVRGHVFPSHEDASEEDSE